MGKRDKSEKLFVACRDVFVEIINVLLYQGEKVLTEEAMLPGPTESFYVGQDAEQHSQFQDYSMFEVRRGEVLALYTMENQSRIDDRMPLRCAGYEGACLPQAVSDRDRSKRLSCFLCGAELERETLENGNYDTGTDSLSAPRVGGRVLE